MIWTTIGPLEGWDYLEAKEIGHLYRIKALTVAGDNSYK